MEYMTGDMDRTTKTGTRTTPIYPGQLCTLLSRAKSSELARIFNFDEANIVVSELVKADIERLRRDFVFSWKHPITQNESIKVCLLNIVSWIPHNQHIFPETTSIQLLRLLINIDGKIIVIVLVYRPPVGQRNSFIYQLLQALSMLEETCHYRTILC